MPGLAGNPGPPGEDGYDVELEPEDELPCVICPAGPPGQRWLYAFCLFLRPKLIFSIKLNLLKLAKFANNCLKRRFLVIFMT